MLLLLERTNPNKRRQNLCQNHSIRIHLLTFRTCFILVRVAMDPEPIPGIHPERDTSPSQDIVYTRSHQEALYLSPIHLSTFFFICKTREPRGNLQRTCKITGNYASSQLSSQCLNEIPGYKVLDYCSFPFSFVLTCFSLYHHPKPL